MQRASEANGIWVHDFVFDTCANDQELKCLTVLDEHTREALAIDVAGSIRRLEARVFIGQWRHHYNEVRPHSALGYLAPAQFVQNQSGNDHEAIRLT